MPVASIAVCSKGRPEELRALAIKLRKLIDNFQSGQSELIIIEDVSELDERSKPERVKEADQYVTIDVHGAGFGLIRQTAVDVAHGEIIIFIDDDCLPCSEKWLPDLLQPFSDRDVVAVGGGILPQDGNAIAKAIALIGLPAGGLPRLIAASEELQASNLLSTGNLALRRSAVLDVGGFDMRHRFGGEDQQLVGRLIGKKFFSATALVAHRNRERLGEVWRWFMRRGRGEYRINRMSGMSKTMSLLYPIRWSWSWRIALLIGVWLLTGVNWLMVGVGAYYMLLGIRIYFQNRKAINMRAIENKRVECIKYSVLLVAPAVKICMDLGREVGRILALVTDKDTA